MSCVCLDDGSNPRDSSAGRDRKPLRPDECITDSLFMSCLSLSLWFITCHCRTFLYLLSQKSIF